jgi:D-alanine-D-alanine ligase
MNRTKVAILYGGRSVEHGVSINSARNIVEYIDKKNFEPLPIGITQNGKWFLTAGVSKDIEQGKPLNLQLDPNHPAFLTNDGQATVADIVFPVLHGTDGEDGSIQGLLKAMELPIIGTGVLGSSMAMNKLVSKHMLQEAGLPVARYLLRSYGSPPYSFEEVKKQLGLPFMVKSASLGSSVGVSKVKSHADFEKAVEESFRYDNVVLFEEFIQGREIECAILGNYPPQSSLPGEIVVNKKYDFYTFDAKYVDSEAVHIKVPAPLDRSQSDLIRDLSVKAFQTLCCEDFARVDLFLAGDNKVYINEINTIPGFTNSSMFPMMWKERGISFTALISRLVELGFERFEKSKRIERDFQSSLKF